MQAAVRLAEELAAREKENAAERLQVERSSMIRMNNCQARLQRAAIRDATRSALSLTEEQNDRGKK